MNTKHTPGPWITERCDNGMEILNDEQESVAVVCHYGDPYSSIREEANARLIAAAPDGLQAAIDALQAADEMGIECPGADGLRAFIAKATL